MIHEFDDLSNFVANECEACVVRLSGRYRIALNAQNEGLSVVFVELCFDAGLRTFLVAKYKFFLNRRESVILVSVQIETNYPWPCCQAA